MCNSDIFSLKMTIYCCFTVLLVSSLGNAQTVVDTEYGRVRGHVVNVNNGVEQTTVDVFYGIPFAKPPVGALRFANPVPPDPWAEILEGDTIRDMCPQLPDAVTFTNPDWTKFGEDCLHLNIYTPRGDQGPYPVMFWIYGGGFQYGGSVQYPGHFLASRGVIVVIINYRLHNIGFSYTGTGASPGNAGLWDQHAALQFVVRNIANFGGDPNRITVFGESAGASSTSIHMLSPVSKALFQQAITESSAETNFWTVNPPESHPENYTRQLAIQLDCDIADDYAMMDCLRQHPWEGIVNHTLTCTPGFPCIGMGPVVDGPGGIVPQMPADLRASGDVMDGPIMGGINEDDGSLGLAAYAPGIVLPGCCNRTYFEHVLRDEMVALYAPRLTNITEEDCFHALNYNYSPWPFIYDAEANRNKLIELYTDWRFGVHWDSQLKDQQEIAPTYGYLFDHSSINSSSPGATHGEELNYVWGTPMLSFNEEVRNDSSCCDDEVVFSDIDVLYAIFVQELWVNFAKYGNPTPYPVNNPLGDSTVWPQFTFDNMNILFLGTDNIGTITEYKQKDYAFWFHYIRWMAGDELGITETWAS